jgi:hypothetical protein
VRTETRPASEPTEAEERPAHPLVRLYLEHEAIRYGLSAFIVVGIMLLLPSLLNNMLLTLIVVLTVVAIVPDMVLRRRR